MAVISTIEAKLEFGLEIEPEDEMIECAIFECHDYLFRYRFWLRQVQENFIPMASDSIEYEDQVIQSILELELMGWQFEPLPDVSPELDRWLSFL